MNNLLEFLTSKEIMIVYVIAGVACLLCFIIYLVEKNNVKRKQRHNTRELNKLVEQIQEEMPEEESSVVYEEPVIQSIEPKKVENEPEISSVVELLDSTEKIRNEQNNQLQNTPVQNTVPTPTREEVIVEPLMVENTNTTITPVVAETPNVDTKPVINNVEEELEYTTIEPDQATAQLELKKITEELRRQEEEEQNNNIQLTNYEEQQEENAIISLQELVSKSKELYAANELSQYADEGNEPISLQELEKKGMSNEIVEEPFIIENVVPKNVELPPEEPVVATTIETQAQPTTVQINKKFQNSPIISPIYGIEGKEATESSLELENTANYDKLDAEIKKTNEFLMTLKELQKKLD